MAQIIQYKYDRPDSIIRGQGKIGWFENTLNRRNYVIAETLDLIENIIPSGFSN